MKKKYDEEESICSFLSEFGSEVSMNRQHFGWELNAPENRLEWIGGAIGEMPDSAIRAVQEGYHIICYKRC